MLLDGKSVAITGATRGIGRATAIACARQGANVGVNTWRDPEGAESVLAEIRALGRSAVAFEADVADPASAPAFIRTAADALGGVDVFVSNAGICPFHSFLDMPREVFERTLGVNYSGAALWASKTCPREKLKAVVYALSTTFLQR
jgi:L-rhamnose 1-dehydrogenase